jgi:DNA-binding IclR family transcriptional regulator
MRTPIDGGAPGAQVVHRVAALLRLVASNNERGLRLIDIESLSGLERSTAHRLLGAMTRENLVRMNAASKRYQLGSAIFEFGLALRLRNDLRSLARPSLDRLAESTGDTVYLMVRSAMEAVCVDRVQGSYPIKILTIDVGGRRPLGINAGSLALLSALDDEEAGRVMAANRARYDQYDGLKAETIAGMVEQTRAVGYALVENQIVPGATAMGVSLLDSTQQVLGAISVAAISSRIGGSRQSELADLLRQEKAAIERLVGQPA